MGVSNEYIHNTFTKNSILDLENGFIESIISKKNQDYLLEQVPKLDLSKTVVKGFVPKL